MSGWGPVVQNELTQSAAAREHRLSVIEQTGHALHGLASQRALELAANQILTLGFDVTTIDYLTTDRATFACSQPLPPRTDDGHRFHGLVGEPD